MATMVTRGVLVMTNVSPDQWSAQITTDRQVIGRSQEAGIRLPGACNSVSRRHAEIWEDRQRIWIRDLQSKWGTLVNGVKIPARVTVELRLGDRIVLGGVALVLVDEAALMLELDHLQRVGVDDDETISGVRRSETSEAIVVPEELPTRLDMSQLSAAEFEVVMWLARGLVDLDQIGCKLHRSPHTVRTQLNSIFRKLHVHSRDQLLGLLSRGGMG